MKEKLSIAGLVLFVIVDVLLVTLAFRHVRPADTSEPTSGQSPATSPTDSPAPSPKKPGSKSPSKSPSKFPKATTSPGRDVTTPLLLGLATDGTVVRAVRGSCGTPKRPTVEVSTDGGETFKKIPVANGLSEVLGVVAAAADDLLLVGTAGTCDPQVYAGAADEPTWTAGPDQGVWHLIRAAVQGESLVRNPTALVGTPCPPVDLGLTGSLRLVCDDGRIFGTRDAGTTWTLRGRLEGVQKVAFSTNKVGYALADLPGCSAQLYVTDDEGTTWKKATCLGDQTPRALAVRGDVLLAQVGGELLRSKDAGDTWAAL